MWLVIPIPIPVDTVLTVGFGLVVGVSLGLLGGGGSVLAVPALVYALGQPLSTAIPTSLLVVGTTSAGGAVSYLRRGHVLWRTALAFGLSGFGGSVVGAWVNHRVGDGVVLVGYAALMLFTARTLHRKAGKRGGAPGPGVEIPALEDRWRSQLHRIVAAGIGVGFVTALFGIGGGFLITPALVVLLGVPVHVAIGTGLLVLVLNATSGFVAHAGYGSVDYATAAVFSAAGIVGAVAGARLARRIDAARLTRVMANAILVLAAFVLVKTLAFP